METNTIMKRMTGALMLAIVVLAGGGAGTPPVHAALGVALGALPALPNQSSTEAWYVMDREGWLQTADTRLVLTRYDLRNGPNLAAVPLQIGAWMGQDLAIVNQETFPTLDAEHIVYRGYAKPDGQMLVLSLIGSTQGQSFHHPLVCYGWAAWPTEDRGTNTILTAGGELVMRLVIGRDPDGPAQVDLHAYLWPNDRRNWADGATQLRVTALATQGEDQALEAAREFVRLLFAQARRPSQAAGDGRPASAGTPGAVGAR